MPNRTREGGIEADIDALYQLPLAEFTAARNALAARLKKAGRAEEAERVKALAKPPLTAWTVNQLYWKKRDPFDRLLAAGERFRTAQTAQLGGKSADVRGPLEAHRRALSEMAKLAAGVLRQAGSSPTPDTMRRVTTTLEALSTYGSLPNAPRAGRLSDDVESPGFETLAALVPRVGASGQSEGPSRIIPFQHKTTTAKKKAPAVERKAQAAAAARAVRDAERALRDARTHAQKAETALKTAAARAKEAEKERAAIETKLEKAAADADAARQHARRVAAEAEDAAQAVEDAERALEQARGEHERLES